MKRGPLLYPSQDWLEEVQGGRHAAATIETYSGTRLVKRGPQVGFASPRYCNQKDLAVATLSCDRMTWKKGGEGRRIEWLTGSCDLDS